MSSHQGHSTVAIKNNMGYHAMFTTLVVTGVMPASIVAYHNISLESPIMSARVFMPLSGKGDSAHDKFYLGSRFEHGSMIGDMIFGGNREVYGRSLWRTPHDPTWPESGVGLASEFGCGDNGATCVGKGDITNGVLGYDTAKVGEPFLKIGVGALIKGSCPDCTAGDDGSYQYKFNSPYKFYRPPSWKVLPSPDPNELTFVSEESLGDVGYRIQKTIRLDGSVLTVRSLLSNLGKKQFTTPWYSHHFFTGEQDPVGPGYKLDLGVSEYALQTPTPVFKQPGLGSWSKDINDYVNVSMARDGSISMELKKVISEGVRLKAEFLDENIITLTDGTFTLHAPNGISVSEKIPELQTQSRNPFIYAYNVYMERGTISPEPIILLYLQPGETTVWTQNLKFSSDRNPAFASLFTRMFPYSKAWQIPAVHGFSFGSMMVFIAACCAMVAASYFTGSRRRSDYTPIPDEPQQKQEADTLSVV